MDDLQHLLKAVKQQHAKEAPQKEVQALLNSIFTNLSRTRHHHEAWSLMVELIAARYRPIELENHGISLLPETKHKDLAEKFSDDLEQYIVAAKEKPMDYIGQIFEEYKMGNQGQVLTPMSIVDAMVKMTLGDAEEITELKTMLDPCTGTGRFLIGATLQYPKAPLILFGIEIDISLYRAAVVNLSMFSRHPFSIICANALMLDPQKIGPNSKIWLMGNWWDPPAQIQEFYIKPETPQGFLDRYMKTP